MACRMANRGNFAHLIKEEFVSRFQDVVKNEINESKNFQTQTGLKFCSLDKDIKALHEKIDLLNAEHAKKIDAILANSLEERKKLHEDFEEQRRFIRTNVNEVRDHIKDVTECISRWVHISDLESLVSRIDSELDLIKVNMNDDKNHITSLIQETKLEVKKSYCEEIVNYAGRIDDLAESFDKLIKKIEGSQVTADGFMREMTIYKKTIFIIEKKIENIYSLIERLEEGSKL